MAKQEFTYDMIKPLIVSEEANGSTMNVQFALPGSDEIHEASASIRQARTVGNQIKKNLTRGIANEARRTIGRMLRGIFGGGFLGRTARSAATTATRETTRNVTNTASQEDKDNAVVDAFRRVANKFAYVDGTWKDAGSISPVVAPDPSAFEAQMTKNPVNGKFERGVLARVLAHIAYADGDLADEEADFFADSIPEEFGKVTDLAEAEAVSSVEAEEIASGIRETIYMLAWTISLIDMDLDPAEKTALSGYRDTFKISEDRGAELEKNAKFHVLQSYLTAETTRDELFEMGGKLGLSNDDAERAKVRWTKRQ